MLIAIRLLHVLIRVFEIKGGAEVWIGCEADIVPSIIAWLRGGVLVSMNDFHRRRQEDVALLSQALSLIDGAIADVMPTEQLPQDAQRAKVAAEALVTAIRNGRRVVVHCDHGLHRSPAAIAAALYLGGWCDSVEEAFDTINRRKRVLREPTASWIVGLVRPGDVEDDFSPARRVGRRFES